MLGETSACRTYKITQFIKIVRTSPSWAISFNGKRKKL